jgi:hypothetical protein
VTIAEALELTALVARKQPERYGRFAARWLCLWLEEHERATLEDVELMVAKLRSLATPKDHGSALAILRKGRTAGLISSGLDSSVVRRTRVPHAPRSPLGSFRAWNAFFDEE